MTLQQVILLIIFVFPIVQALARAITKKRAASRRDEPELVFAPPHVRVPPAPVRDLPVQLRTAPPPPPAALRQTHAEPLKEVSRLGTSLLPRDRVGLQRAAALVAILGPPRALEPYGR